MNELLVKNGMNVRYSTEVWIPADKEKLFCNLNTSERDILNSKAWPNDIVIDSSMDLLKTPVLRFGSLSAS